MKEYIFTHTEKLALRDSLETDILRLRDRANWLYKSGMLVSDELKHQIAVRQALLDQFKDDIRLGK